MKIKKILFCCLLALSITSCNYSSKEAAKEVAKDVAKEDIVGTYTGTVTYTYKYSSVIEGAEDKVVTEQKTVQIMKDSNSTYILFQNQTIKLAAIILLNNGIAFNIAPQVISTTEGGKPIKITGNTGYVNTDGTKADGGFNTKANSLNYFYNGLYPETTKSGKLVQVPYLVSFNMKKLNYKPK